MSIELAQDNNHALLEHLHVVGTDFYVVEHDVQRLREDNQRLRNQVLRLMADLGETIEHLRKTQIELDSLKAA